MYKHILLPMESSELSIAAIHPATRGLTRTSDCIEPRVASEVAPVMLSHPAHEGPPEYLAVHYWWAYVHPWAVKLFERQWLVNLILGGQYGRLRDAALSNLVTRSEERPCRSPALTETHHRLCNAVATGGGEIDIVDVCRSSSET